MTTDRLSKFRKIADRLRSVGDRLSVREHELELVILEWSGERPGLGTKTEKRTELLIDGYYKPYIRELYAKEVIASNGLYNNADIEVKFTQPYTDCCTGEERGFNFSTFEVVKLNPPTINTNHYIEIKGPRYNGKFHIVEINRQSSLTIRLILRNTGAPNVKKFKPEVP